MEEMMQHLQRPIQTEERSRVRMEQEHLKEGRYTLNMVKIDRKVREVLNHIKLEEAKRAFAK